MQFESSLVFIDCEMTGLDPEVHKIWEIAAIKVNPKNLSIEDTFRTYVGPSSGYTVDYLLEKADTFSLTKGGLKENYENLKYAPDITKVIEQFNSWLPNHYILSGFNLTLDFDFLKKAFIEVRASNSSISKLGWRYIDTYTLYEMYLAQNNLINQPFALKKICTSLNLLDKDFKEHSALDDVYMSYYLFKFCLDLFK